MNAGVLCHLPLSLCKGEGRVRVGSFIRTRQRTPHLNPLPLTKGRSDHFDFDHICFYV
jgi:hypothetical protein